MSFLVERILVRKIAALLLPVLLLLTACSGTDDQKGADASALDSITVTDAKKGEAPKVEFDAPLTIDKRVVTTLEAGDGKTVEAGQTVTMRAVGYNAEDGSKLGDTYGAPQGQNLDVNDALKTSDAELYDALVGATVGTRIALGFPATEAQAEAGQPAQPAQILVFTIKDVQDPPKPMAQSKVSQLEKDGKLPSVTFDDKNEPSITIPDGVDPPKKVAVQVLKEGDGTTVTKDMTVKAKYLGVKWSDGKKFDSSYDRGKPAEFPLSGVIPGWRLGLAGQSVGSTVALTIPAELAYGKDPAQGAPAGALVFVVDIVDASK